MTTITQTQSTIDPAIEARIQQIVTESAERTKREVLAEARRMKANGPKR